MDNNGLDQLLVVSDSDVIFIVDFIYLFFFFFLSGGGVKEIEAKSVKCLKL